MAKANPKGDDTEERSAQRRTVQAAAHASDYDNYIADMILELQQMAARSGRHALAERLLAAHELARDPRPWCSGSDD
ncbi:MAG: hypothetical protein APF80_10850 [Alphaproteobacteria bacterium BRH_c36]|nr:MAG: hypothetical protein APF80_10850 [Alphaproteobacteria bacterium BRH_c36]